MCWSFLSRTQNVTKKNFKIGRFSSYSYIYNFKFLALHMLMSDSSVGRAIDFKSKGSRFDPQQIQNFFYFGTNLPTNLDLYLAFLTSDMHKILKNLNIIIITGILSQYSYRNNLWTILAHNSHCSSSQ